MKFLAVDLSSVFRRMWEASEGKDFGEARQRTVRKIQHVSAGHDRVLLACDRGVSFRKALFPAYKTNRLDPGEAYREQLKLVVADLRETGATPWASPPLGQHEGRQVFGEADDVIASFVLWCQDHTGEADWSLTIFTGDTDLWALVDDELAISVLTLEEKMIRVDQVVERFGVPPHLVPECKALTGDSDNYKGFPGIGDATARAILTQANGLQHAEDRSSSDAIVRAICEGSECAIKLPKNVVAAIKDGGPELLNLGRTLAYLRPLLLAKDGQYATLDFSAVLAEPRAVPRAVDPVYERAAEKSLASAAPPPPAPSPPSAAMELAPPRELSRADAELPFMRSLNKALTFAAEMHKSGLFRNLPNPAACLVVLEHARAFGVPGVIAAQHAHCIKGKLGFGSQLLMGVILQHPSTIRFRFDGRRCSDRSATVLYGRRCVDGDDSGEYAYTIEMAQRAGCFDGQHSAQWKQAPHVMLKWAAARECARMVWPDVAVGIRTPEDEGTAGEFPAEMLEPAE